MTAYDSCRFVSKFLILWIPLLLRKHVKVIQTFFVEIKFLFFRNRASYFWYVVLVSLDIDIAKIIDMQPNYRFFDLITNSQSIRFYKPLSHKHISHKSWTGQEHWTWAGSLLTMAKWGAWGCSNERKRRGQPWGRNSSSNSEIACCKLSRWWEDYKFIIQLTENELKSRGLPLA